MSSKLVNDSSSATTETIIGEECKRESVDAGISSSVVIRLCEGKNPSSKVFLEGSREEDRRLSKNFWVQCGRFVSVGSYQKGNVRELSL